MNKFSRVASMCLVLVFLFTPQYSKGYSCTDFDDDDDSSSIDAYGAIDFTKISLARDLPQEEPIAHHNTSKEGNHTMSRKSRVKRDSRVFNTECSIFPNFPLPLQSRLSGVLMNAYNGFSERKAVRTPFDKQLALLGGMALFAPNSAVKPLMRTISSTKETLQIMYQVVEIIDSSTDEFLGAVEEAGLVPPGLLEFINSLKSPAQASSRRSFDGNATTRGEPQRSQSISEARELYQITATKALILYGIPVFVYVGLPQDSADEIEKILKKNLRKTFHERYDCEPRYEIIENPVAGLLQDRVREPVARGSIFFGQIIVRSIGLRPSKLAKVQELLRNIPSEDSTRTLTLPSLEALIIAIKDSIPAGLAYIRELIQQILENFEYMPIRYSEPQLRQEGLDRVLAALSHDISPCEASKLFNPILSAAFEAAQNALEIPQAQSILQNLDEIRPIAGVTSPSSLVTILKNKVPPQVARLNSTLHDLERTVGNLFEPLNPFESMKDIGLGLQREVRRLNKAVVSRSFSCATSMSQSIRKLSTTANDGIQACVSSAAAASDALAHSVRSKVHDVVRSFRKYYDGLSEVTKSSANQYIQTGDQLINSFANYVSNLPTTLETSGLRVKNCGKRIMQSTRAESASISVRIAEC